MFKDSSNRSETTDVDRTGLDRDDGGIVLGWLLKLLVVFALVAIASYDTIAIVYGRVVTADDARLIARAASDAMILERADAKEAVAVAVSHANTKGVELDPKDVTIDKKGSVTVVVHRDVTTLVAHYIGPLADFTHVEERYTTPPVK